MPFNPAEGVKFSVQLNATYMLDANYFDRGVELSAGQTVSVPFDVSAHRDLLGRDVTMGWKLQPRNTQITLDPSELTFRIDEDLRSAFGLEVRLEDGADPYSGRLEAQVPDADFRVRAQSVRLVYENPGEP